MISRITAGALAASAIAALSAGLPAGPAVACNRTDGCVHDAQLESYKMMHDGGMSEAMRSGAANLDAFRSMGTMTSRQDRRRPEPRKRPPALSAR